MADRRPKHISLIGGVGVTVEVHIAAILGAATV